MITYQVEFKIDGKWVNNKCHVSARCMDRALISAEENYKHFCPEATDFRLKRQTEAEPLFDVTCFRTTPVKSIMTLIGIATPRGCNDVLASLHRRISRCFPGWEIKAYRASIPDAK